MWRLTMREREDSGADKWKPLLWGMRRDEAEHYFAKFQGYMPGSELRLLAPDGSTVRASSS